jgi:glucokinase
MKLIGVDIGGTTIKGALLNDGEVLKEASAPTHGREGRTAILASLYHVIDALQTNGVEGIGISSAGNIDNEKGVCVYATSNLLGWGGLDIKSTIQDKYGLPCAVDNDAVCALKGELSFYPEATNVTMLTFGTGVGGASMVNGQILRGKNFDAARWGHLCVSKNGKPCSCGKRGCAEMYLSATALLREGRKAIRELYTCKELFALAEKGDKRAQGVLEKFGEYLDVLLDNIRTAVAPELIILGGGVAQSEAQISSVIANKEDIAFAKLGNRAGIIGAVADFQK